MVRTREQLGNKKRARGSGSNQPEPNPDVEMEDAPPRQIPPNRRDTATQHVFDRLKLTFKNPDYRSKFTKLKGRKIYPSKFICSDTLATLGIYDCVKEMFTNVSLWTFLSEPLDTYADLTLEFLSTFRYNDFLKEITFKLGGSSKITLNKNKLSSILQFDCPVERLQPKPCDYHQFITAITGLEKHSDKVSQIQHLAWKYVQKVLSHTIFGRGETSSKYKQDEISVMYCMSQLPASDDFVFPDIPLFIMRHLDEIAKKPDAKGDILIGGLVTRIALHLNVDLRQSVHVPGSNVVDLDSLVQYNFLECIGQPPLERYEYQFKKGPYPIPLPYPFNVYDPDTYLVPPPGHTAPQHEPEADQSPEHDQPHEDEPDSSNAPALDPYAALQSQLAQMQLGFTATYGQLRNDYNAMATNYTNLQSGYTALHTEFTNFREEVRESQTDLYDYMGDIHRTSHDTSWWSREYYNIAHALSPHPMQNPPPQPPPPPARERPRWYRRENQ